MALRNLERKPWQAFFTALGLALATGIPVVPGAMRDGLPLARWRPADKTSVDVIARETGVSKATVFREFPEHACAVQGGAASRICSLRRGLGNSSRRGGSRVGSLARVSVIAFGAITAQPVPNEAAISRGRRARAAHAALLWTFIVTQLRVLVEAATETVRLP